MSLNYTERVSLYDLFRGDFLGKEVVVCGWARTVRRSKGFGFVVISDGSAQETLQIVIDESLDNYETLISSLTGTCLIFRGEIVKSQGKGQSFEMQASQGEILGGADESYPLQKKATSLEFLRENAHLRARTNLFGAIFRLRHSLSLAVHQFFDEKRFFYLHSPILTGIDAEGAGEMFTVTSKDLKNLDEIPRCPSDKKSMDFKQDYFAKEASLCVTGQLEAECFALGLGQVYTFGPTFRAENSNTHRHLSEFWMIEPEAAFMNLEGNAKLAVEFVQFLISWSFDKCSKELEALDKYHQFSAKQQKLDYLSHLNALEKLKDSTFNQMTYTEAIDVLLESKKKFEFRPQWGSELQTEHEKFLAEHYFKGPVVVTDYPKDCKAFYMKQNDDGKTVRAMDVLVPGVGEIIGGSQREESLKKLDQRIDELGMQKDILWWYRDLRKFGSAPHSGFGLGFERMLMYLTGMKNIRDVIAFPRTPNNCDF